MIETAISEILENDSVTENLFLGVFARNELPENPLYPSCFVFNTAPRSNSGQHWLGLYYDFVILCL